MSFADRTQAIIEDIGQPVTFTRVTPGTLNTSMQHIDETVVTKTVKASVRHYRAREISGLVQNGDREVRIAALSLGFAPTIKDRITIDSRPSQIISVNIRSPRGEPAIYIIQVRG